jgi:hypothetical protein
LELSLVFAAVLIATYVAYERDINVAQDSNKGEKLIELDEVMTIGGILSDGVDDLCRAPVSGTKAGDPPTHRCGAACP